jgi:signal transduction histidine kinase
MHDVTSVVSMQEEIQRSEAMAKMGTLVAGVAHEVRNPLFSMTATLDAFEVRNTDGTMHRHLEILRSQLSRLQGLMQDLLDYGRPQALDLSCVTARAVLERAVDATAVEATAAQADVVVTGEGLDVTLRGDEDRLVQVFVNLLSNALHFAPAHSTVAVTVNDLQQADRRWVTIEVRDEGPGFSPDDLSHLFEPFFTKRAGGTGLGLAIVRRGVEQHGGRVTAEAPEGGGGLVRVRLPVSST